MGWSRLVAVVALTTRQRLKERSSSSPRKAVRPLVAKQTEYPKRERENCQVWEVIQSLYPFLLCHLSAQFSCFFLTKGGWFFTFQGDPARSFSCLFALGGKSQHTEVNQIAKARHSVWQHCPKPPTPLLATDTEGSRSSGWKGHPGSDSCS